MHEAHLQNTVFAHLPALETLRGIACRNCLHQRGGPTLPRLLALPYPAPSKTPKLLLKSQKKLSAASVCARGGPAEPKWGLHVRPGGTHGCVNGTHGLHGPHVLHGREFRIVSLMEDVGADGDEISASVSVSNSVSVSGSVGNHTIEL